MSSTTTREASTSDIILGLNRCIETCQEGERGWAGAANDARDPVLRALFQRTSDERAEWVVALQAAIIALGGLPEPDGAPPGVLNRSWTGLRRTLEGRSDRVVIEECQRGEHKALAVYQSAVHRMDRYGASPDVRAMPARHHATITASLEELKRRARTAQS